jgi:hypothetical protein
MFFLQSLQSQIIALHVNASGNAAISIDGKTLTPDEEMTLSIPPGSGLRFDFSNIKDMTALFRLTGALQDDGTELELDSNYFKVARTLSTDNKLTVQVGAMSVNINRPFNILIGSRRPGKKTMKATIFPQIASAAPAAPSTAAPAVNNKSAGDEEEEKNYRPGSAVYDALKLSDNEHLSEEELRRIIKYYFPDATVDDVESAKRIAATNPFLAPIVFNPLKPAKETVAEAGGDLLSSLSFSSIGGLDVTNIADGLAKFLVKRTREELSIAFFKKFRDAVNGNEDLKVLFPLTVKILLAIDEEVYNYERYIQNLREAFKEDIVTLHHNLPGIVPIHHSYFSAHPVQKSILLTGCYLAVELENQTHAGDILANYPTEYLDSVGSINV